MSVTWTPHRFAGGALALDVANTVVLRNDPDRTFDRFDNAAELQRFADAATRLRADELGGGVLVVPDAEAARAAVLPLRAALDRLFRGHAETGEIATGALATMLTACADGLAQHGGVVAAGARGFEPGRGAGPIALEAAVAISALSLLSGERLRRIRICANCDWLFVDTSRNSSRVWCDMAVCGNRQKSKRHYRRRKAPAAEDVTR